MWAVLNGVNMSHARKGGRFDVPYDSADFGRCYDYVKKCAVTFAQLQLIGSVLKWFSPFIENWETLCEMYEKQMIQPSKERTHELYNFIQDLEKQSRLLDGWVDCGGGMWKRERIPEK